MAGQSLSRHSLSVPMGARVAASCSPAWISTGCTACLAEDATQGHGIALVLIDGEGTLLAHTPPLPDQVGKSMAGHPLARSMLKTSEGEAELPDLQGVQRLFAHVPLTGTGARLAVGVDRALILAKADEQRVFSFAMLLLVATGSMIGAALAGEVLVLRWLDAVREAAAVLAGAIFPSGLLSAQRRTPGTRGRLQRHGRSP